MSKDVNWIFGRGASIEFNLTWTVPEELSRMSRDNQIAEIKSRLRKEMDKPTVDVTPYSKLLAVVREKTAPGWRHRFITTN